jgi:hypothetical protein
MFFYCIINTVLKVKCLILKIKIMKNEKNTTAVTTRIPYSTWEWLTSIGPAGEVLKAIVYEAERAYKYGISPYKISESLSELQMIRRRSMAEIKGVFTQEEWSFMADSLRCIHGAHIANIEDSDIYAGLGAKWGVDVKDLCSKIEKLTAAQVDAVFTRIQEFWKDEDRDLEADEDRDLEAWARW